MLSKRDNELLTRVGPGTPMGQLMRRYWHPIAGSAELETSPFRTKEVRLMGEDLVLYRDRSGRLGLIDRWCSHRRVNLAYGVVEEDGLRCQYHGWKFDQAGTCIEQPFEETVHPDGRFKEKCGVAGYQVQELAGLIFAYMGPQPVPLLPRWEPLAWDNVVRDIAVTELPCNWLQCQENSVDPTHSEWLHGYFGSYVRTLPGRGTEPAPNQLPRIGRRHQKIGFDVFDYGIIKRRVQEGGTEEDEDWAHGHPILFPHILLVGDQFQATMQFRVPIDDTHTLHVSQYIFRPAPGTEAPAQTSVPVRWVTLFDESGSWVVDYTFNQDYMAWSQQGPIAERHREKLGEGDKGIILYRRLLRQQLDAVLAGRDPMNTFRDPEKNRMIALPLEKVKRGISGRPQAYVPGESGYSVDAPQIEATYATWDKVGSGTP
ncbi:MAG: aromatic ring-hydroxylating dioxygenase subunit alpha [Dehalococcoidia bacterium]|nr:aromatic ring-hydroxylating dioxygenase subunit alpha [Dehalococcoidia bacterium]